MLETLDAAALRRWCAGGLAELRRHQSEINRLNVYPVPDGDTGTNLVLTLASAQQALLPGDAIDEGPPAVGESLVEDPATSPGQVLRQMARGALLGARGNSGVIMAQVLRGLADVLGDIEVVRGRALASALRVATTAAYAAVAKPVEGTLLTVIAAAATAAEQADSDELAAVTRTAAEAAAVALARTPEQLPVLARAGVVDAGGRGLCVLLDALHAVVVDAPQSVLASAPVAANPPVPAVGESDSPEYAYEVQFLLDADDAAVRRLRAALGSLGDSLAIVGTKPDRGGTPTWNVHVHVNDVGAALEAGIDVGRPYQIRVNRFDDQSLGGRPVPGPAAAQLVAAPTAALPESQSGRSPAVRRSRGAVVVAAGDGLTAIFSDEGATVVADNPSTGEILTAIHATGADRVVVLPNDPDTHGVASAAAAQAHAAGLKVSVVPTRSPVQALAALAVRDPDRRFEDDVIAMAEAAGACRYAEVCYAQREALTVAGPCRAGEVLALVDGEVHLIGDDLVHTGQALLDALLGGGGELVTLLLGLDAPAGLAEALQSHVEHRWPFVEVQSYQGGQPFYPLLVGVE